MGRCPRFSELWADTCEMGKGFIDTATTVLTERGWGFTYTVQICLDRIDPFHTLQPYSIFRISDVLQRWMTRDTSAASTRCRAVRTKIVCHSFMARRLLTLATYFKMLLLGALSSGRCFLHSAACVRIIVFSEI